ncbi:hypothetical protein ACSLGF_01430 [Bacillus sp. A015]
MKVGDCMYPRAYGGFHGGGFSGGGAHIGPVGTHIGFGGFGTFSGYPYGSMFIMGCPPGFYVRSY